VKNLVEKVQDLCVFVFMLAVYTFITAVADHEIIRELLFICSK